MESREGGAAGEGEGAGAVPGGHFPLLEARGKGLAQRSHKRSVGVLEKKPAVRFPMPHGGGEGTGRWPRRGCRQCEGYAHHTAPQARTPQVWSGVLGCSAAGTSFVSVAFYSLAFVPLKSPSRASASSSEPSVAFSTTLRPPPERREGAKEAGSFPRLERQIWEGSRVSASRWLS